MRNMSRKGVGGEGTERVVFLQRKQHVQNRRAERGLQAFDSCQARRELQHVNKGGAARAKAGGWAVGDLGAFLFPAFTRGLVRASAFILKAMRAFGAEIEQLYLLKVALSLLDKE